MRIYELPTEIQNRIFQLQTEAGNKPNADLNLHAKPEEGGFAWHLTTEGFHFWNGIYKGFYRIFYDRYPNTPAIVTPKDDSFIKLILDCIDNGPFTQGDFIEFTKRFTEPRTELSKKFEGLANEIINCCSFNLSEHNGDELREAITKKFLKEYLYNAR